MYTAIPYNVRVSTGSAKVASDRRKDSHLSVMNPRAFMIQRKVGNIRDGSQKYIMLQCALLRRFSAFTLSLLP